MPVWKRYRGKRVKRGDPNYDKGTWIAEGRVDGEPYKQALPRETIKTAEQARGKDDEIRASLRAGDVLNKTGFTKFIDEVYLPYCKTNLESYGQKILHCNILKSFFKDKLIRSITLAGCEEFKRWRKSQNVRCQKCENKIEHICDPVLISNGAVNRELGTLSAIFDLAVKDRKARDNPMRFVPRLEEGARRERFLYDDEKARLLDELKHNFQLYCIVIIGLLTGWRKQQILHLKVTDLDEQKVWIQKQKRKPRRKVVVGKTVWTLLTMLADIRTDWLFLNPSGNRLVEFNPAWWKALDRAGIDDFRFHDLRHSFATSLLDNDVAEFAIQHALGHSRIQTTQGYAHVKDEQLRIGLDRISEGLNLEPQTILTPSDKVM